MRVDPSYVTNLVGSLDQAQANEQQLTAELSSGVSFTALSQNPVAAGENVLLLNQIQQDDTFMYESASCQAINCFCFSGFSGVSAQKIPLA